MLLVFVKLYLTVCFDVFAVSLEDSLWILYKYVRDSAQGEFSLDHVLVPMIEHVCMSISLFMWFLVFSLFFNLLIYVLSHFDHLALFYVYSGPFHSQHIVLFSYLAKIAHTCVREYPC